MTYGIVSNCWRAQLEAGASLDELIAEAVRRGYDHVELRQGCLGAYESGAGNAARPEAGTLLQLPTRFPGLRFNLALALPFLSGAVTPETTLFAAGLRSALFLSGAGRAHLRLVDPETPPEALTPARRVELAERLTALALACDEAGALLSVENARQPWAALHDILSRARASLGERRAALGLCYDPCNLLSAADRPDPLSVTSALRAEEIALFHYKQTRDGAPYPEVAPGDIDWASQIRALRRVGYAGSRLFEIPPGADVWDHLERSREYLDTLEQTQ